MRLQINMNNFKTITLAICCASAALLLPKAQSNPYVIADTRARNIDITPVLGRGYSIMTNTYQSTCLMVDETTVPSYNYDYAFYDFSGPTDDLQLDIAAMFSFSFSYQWLKADIKPKGEASGAGAAGTATETVPSTEGSSTKYIASSMRIERYYSSLKEESSVLSADAQTLINRKDYVGFFKSCGPTYIRAIRRAQEVSAFFIFQSTSTENSQNFAANIAGSSGGLSKTGSANPNPKFLAESKSMKIVIKGYGLGLSQNGSESLVARGLDDYNKVMKFAFHSMTKIEGYQHIGMVYGMEVYPWVYNAQFLIQTGLQDDTIEIPISRKMIPKAYKIAEPTNTVFDNTNDASRALYKCKNPTFEIDSMGYCCEAEALYNYARAIYDDTNPNERACRPVKTLSSDTVRDNMAANGEFVARLDSTVRLKLNQLNKLEKCISAANAIPDRYNYHLLQSQDNAAYDAAPFSVYDIKNSLDPFSDFSMVKHMAKELDEFIEMYISPCYAAIFGTNIGTSPGTNPAYFNAYPWYSHTDCTRLSCLASGMRWDRSNPAGGCIVSLLAGTTAPPYSGDSNCSKTTNNAGEQVCKQDSTELSDFHTRITSCWSNSLPSGNVLYFLDNYCMPALKPDGATLGITDINRIKQSVITSCSDPNDNVERTINVAEGKSATQSSTYSNDNKAGKAVDGNIDGSWHKKTTSCTKNQVNPWWSVALGGSYTINKIVLYNRQDGGSSVTQRLQGYKVALKASGTEVWSRSYTSGDVAYETEITDGLGAVVGDQVEVSIAGTGKFLTLAEVQVWNIF